MGQKKQKKLTAKTGAAQQHQQKSFNKLVGEASLEKVKPFVQAQVQQLGMEMQQALMQTVASLVNRLVVLEELAVEKSGVSMEELINRVADLEDKQTNYEKVEEVIEGDLVRLKIATKMEDQEDFQGESALAITGCGKDPLTLGPELEPQLIGMQVGDMKQIAFGKDKKMIAKIEVQRVSRKIVVEEGTDEN